MEDNLKTPPFEDLTQICDMPGYIRIRFGDYFDVRQPRYKRLDQLDRAHCYYLSDAWDKLNKYINNPALDHIPFEVLESVRVWDIGRYDTLIDVNGDVVDLSCHSKYYTGKWHGVVPNDDIDVSNWLCRLSAINNVKLNDMLDIEASILYNLYEVVPLTNLISVDFLRYYFWCDGALDSMRRDFNMERDSKIPTLGTLFLFQTEATVSNELEEDTGGLVRTMLDCEALKNEEADLESFEQHEAIIAAHRIRMEVEAEKNGALFLKAAFGSSHYEQLRSLERKVLNKIQLERNRARKGQRVSEPFGYSGFVSELEHFETNYHTIKVSGIKRVYNIPLKVVEVVLRAKLWYKLGNRIVYDGIMMNDLLDVLCTYWDSLCNMANSYEQRSELIQSIKEIARERNTWAHGSKCYSIEEADMLMQKVYGIIKEINQIM